MSRSAAVLAVMLAASSAGAALTGCTGQRPFVREGDATSVQVGYMGDAASAIPVARRHCAQFERVPHLVQTEVDTAFFDCVRPGGAS